MLFRSHQADVGYGTETGAGSRHADPGRHRGTALPHREKRGGGGTAAPGGGL